MLSNTPMFSNAMVQIGLYLIVLLLVTKPMGIWIYKVMHGESTIANKLGGPIEGLIYRALGIKPEQEMNWKHYAVALMIFNVIGVIAVYVLQRWQACNCLDNAVTERFFRSLKSERVNYRQYKTRAEGMADIADYIESFYNQKRRHSTLGNISPVEYEARQLNVSN